MQIRVAHQLEIRPSLHCIRAAALLLAVLCSGAKAGRLLSCFLLPVASTPGARQLLMSACQSYTPGGIDPPWPDPWIPTRADA
jgi:hypothetical protein